MHPEPAATTPRAVLLLVLAILVAMLAAGFAHTAPAAAAPAPAAAVPVLELAHGSPAVPCPAGEPDGDPHCGAAIAAPSAAIAVPALRTDRSLSEGRRSAATEPKGSVPEPDLRLLSIDRR